SHAAAHLAVDDHGIYHDAAVFYDDIIGNSDVSGCRVDLDQRGVRRIGEHARWVGGTTGLQQVRVVILERVGTKMHCLGNIVNRDLRVWRAPDLRSALDQFDIGGVGFQELGGDLFQLIGQP